MFANEATGDQTMSKLSTARPVPAALYRDGGPGFLVEAEGWRIGDDAPSYAIPEWEEMGCADLAETFASEFEALAAIRAAQETWL